MMTRRRPAWLPPLNSHEDYSIYVGVHQSSHDPTPTRSPRRNLKSIVLKFSVDVKFYSGENQPPLDGLSLFHIIPIRPVPTSCVNKWRELVEQILGDRDFVPFKLNNIKKYRETDELEPRLDQSYDRQVHRKSHLVSRFSDFLFRTMNKYSQKGGEDLEISLLIQKSVTVPDKEFEAWTSWYEEKKRVDPHGFEMEYSRAIRVPRTEREFWYESSLLAYESASESCIESLEKLALEEFVGDDMKISCSICLEELGKGEQVTKLPCSHVFHGDCVIQWLKTNHFCPLCRFMMPTSL